MIHLFVAATVEKNGKGRESNKIVIAHHQPININQSKVRATLEFSFENSIGNSSVASNPKGR